MVPPAADQVTPVFDVPVTVAVNCCVPPVCTDADKGLIATDTVEGPGFDAEGLAEPPQPVRSRIVSKPKVRTVVIPHRCRFLVWRVEVKGEASQRRKGITALYSGR
jgi:hypothetical protein